MVSTGAVAKCARGAHCVWKPAADKFIKLWDADTGDIIHTFEGHTEGVSDIAWAGNGDFLASASDDKTVRLWSMESVRELPHRATHI